MKRFILFLIATLLFFCLDAQNLKVLFVGNSYMQVNDLPSILSDLARSEGKDVRTRSFTNGGARFMSHWQNKELLSEIENGGYDVLVLQGQSQEVAFPPEQFQEEVYPYAKSLDSLYKAHNPYGRVVYFMTWGYRYGDQLNCPFYPPFCTYETMSQELCQNYSLMADDFHSEVSPIGKAWLYLFEQDSLSFDMHSQDNSHPNMNGSYFSACVLYNTLFGKAINSDYFSTLDPQKAQYFQQTANELCFNYEFIDCNFVSALKDIQNTEINISYIAAMQTLQIINNGNEKVLSAEIYNLNGVKVEELQLNGNQIQNFDVKALIQGYYIVKIHTLTNVCTYNFVK